MKHIITSLLILLTVSDTGTALAKENKDLMKANYYYNHMAFHEAIPFYEKIADGIKDPTVYTQLGDCYRLTGSLDRSASWYDKAVKVKGCSPSVMLRYGQVLMQLTQYAEAEKWLKGYQKTQKYADRRVTNLIAGCENAIKMKDEAPAGTTSLLAFNGDGAEFAPTIWKDRLVFSSDTVIDLKKKKDNWTGHAYYNIYSVSCDDKGNCGTDFRVIADAKKLNIKYHNGPATFSADGKTMYYTRSRYNDKFFGQRSISNKDTVVLLEIMIASGYDDSTKEFKEIVPFGYNSKEYSVAHPAVSPNGRFMVFSSNMPKGTGGSDLYMSKKTGDVWGKPVAVGNIINTEGEEVFPYWADDNTLFFSSDGHQGYGGLDIYRTHWDEKLNKFSAPENIGTPVNSSYDDISLAMYPDDRSTYFSSNRPSAKGGDNIYFYKKQRLLLQVNVKDADTKEPISGAKVTLKGGKDDTEKDIDNTGKQFTSLLPSTQYNISAAKEEYSSNKISLYTAENNGRDTIIKELLLTKLPPKLDTVKPVVAQVMLYKNQSIMDSPGIQEFVLEKTYEVGHFYFDYNKADIRDVHKRFLDTLMAQMNRHPTMRIQLIAHTDCRGTAKSNQVLSNKRAEYVVNYLVAHGIARRRLEFKGVGSSQPAVKCAGDCATCTEEQHSLNRVLELKVLKL
jgi:outer membrane protein OmpA-like peptidoglycan-associated protein/tetratricopeptide (TPR) repeat protein